MNARNPGTLLVVVGLALVALGFLWRAGWLGWFGHLPGDFRVEREGMKIMIPLASMLLVSIVLNLCLYAARRLFGS